ncbi:reverse transcriptase domain-containing protein [Microbacterium pseudoresistens]|uniref:RNA-directed DNA polymerase n=1 Tax=Microbacterium pseudoresistens TaxID=640634 RepID=A0A7Y9ETB1_9MICO|nr:hypothetical protein [Microbacterium pseudoresistens]
MGIGVEVVTLRSKGKARVIACPTDEAVRNVHRRILSLLTPVQMDLPDMVTGYVRGRSSVTNAIVHAGAAHLQKFDLRDFFPHIGVDAVDEGLHAAGFQEEVARLLSRLTTCRGYLPAGFSTSPAIANLACQSMDAELAALAEQEMLNLTRYADDIAFSGMEPFDVLDEVRQIAIAHGHALNDEKTRTLKRGQPMYVTGLSVSEQERPRLPRPFKRGLRQELYYVQTRGLAEHASWRGAKAEAVRYRLGGQLAYASAVEPGWVEALTTAFPTAFQEVARRRSSQSDAKRGERLAQLAARVIARNDAAAELYEPSATIS